MNTETERSAVETAEQLRARRADLERTIDEVRAAVDAARADDTSAVSALAEIESPVNEKRCIATAQILRARELKLQRREQEIHALDGAIKAAERAEKEQHRAALRAELEQQTRALELTEQNVQAALALVEKMLSGSAHEREQRALASELSRLDLDLDGTPMPTPMLYDYRDTSWHLTGRRLQALSAEARAAGDTVRAAWLDALSELRIG